MIDGCYWHGCPEHGTRAKTNAEYWGPKIARNIERDKETTGLLEDGGWIVIRAWEHEDPDEVSARVVHAVQEAITNQR